MPALEMRAPANLSTTISPSLPPSHIGTESALSLTVKRFENGTYTGSFGVSVGLDKRDDYHHFSAAEKAFFGNALIAAYAEPSSQI